MKRGIIGVFVLLLGFGVRAFGNLGDGDAELTTHYGTALRQEGSKVDGLVTKFYSHRGYLIAVTFLNGRSQNETIRRMGGRELSIEEINAILLTNDFGDNWFNIKGGTAGPRWVLDSKAAVACYSRMERKLVLATKGFMEFAEDGTRVSGPRVDYGFLEDDNWW